MPELMGISFSDVANYAEMVQVLAQHRSEPFGVVVTMNPEIWVRMQSDSHLATHIQTANWVVADGAGFQLAARLLGVKAPAKITGVDLTDYLLRSGGWRVMLVGASPPIVAEAFQVMKRRYPQNEWLGFHHGYFGLSDQEAVLNKVEQLSPNLVLAAMGSPKQDIFLAQLKRRLPSGIGMGVGGVLDVMAGQFQRAPRWVQMMGLEWLFRVIQDPKRMGRLGFIPRFLIAVLNMKWAK